MNWSNAHVRFIRWLSKFCGLSERLLIVCQRTCEFPLNQVAVGREPSGALQSTFLLLILALCIFFQQAGMAADHAPRVLMLTQSKGFVHQPVKRPEGQLADCELAMRQLSVESKEFTLETSQDAAMVITRENLPKFDIVMFYTSGDLPISADNMEYFINDWLKQSGHGFIGVHSSTDTLKENKLYYEMIGGSFIGHPWGANTPVTLSVHEPNHPTMVPFGKEVSMKEEIYQYRNWRPENVRVLMSLDMEKTELKRPTHVPVAWVKEWGKGRIYYNNLGHRPDTWRNKQFMESILAAIRWINSDGDAQAAPNPELSKQLGQVALKAAGQ